MSISALALPEVRRLTWAMLDERKDPETFRGYDDLKFRLNKIRNNLIDYSGG